MVKDFKVFPSLAQAKKFMKLIMSNVEAECDTEEPLMPGNNNNNSLISRLNALWQSTAYVDLYKCLRSEWKGCIPVSTHRVGLRNKPCPLKVGGNLMVKQVTCKEEIDLGGP